MLDGVDLTVAEATIFAARPEQESCTATNTGEAALICSELRSVLSRSHPGPWTPALTCDRLPAVATTETALLERVREALEEELRPLVDQLLEPTVRRLVRERLNGHAGDASVAPEPEPELEAPATKTCTSCGETKPLGAFGPQRAHCRACRAAYDRERGARLGSARTEPRRPRRRPRSSRTLRRRSRSDAGRRPRARPDRPDLPPRRRRRAAAPGGAAGQVLEEGGRYRLVDGALAPSVARALVGLEPPDPRGGDR